MIQSEYKNHFFEYFQLTLLLIIGFIPLFSQPVNVCLVLLLILLNFKITKKYNKNKLILFIFFSCIFIFNLFRDFITVGEFSLLDLYFILTFFLGFLFSEKYDLKEFFYMIEKIIFIIACISIIGVFIYTFLPEIIIKFPSYNYYHTTHITSYFHNFLLVEGNVLKRNSGIAWEPGAFQFILNLGLFSYLKFNNRYKYIHICIYLLTIVTTLSSTGLIILALMLLKFFWKNRKLRLLLITLLISSFPLIQKIIIEQINNKFNDANMFIRFNPMLTAFKEGSNNFFGLGNILFEREYIIKFQYPWDSYGQIFLRYGYVLLLTIVSLILSMLTTDFLLFIIILLSFFTENIWFFPIVTTLYFYSFNNFRLRV